MKHTHLIALISLLALLLLVGGVQALNTTTYTSGAYTITIFDGSTWGANTTNWVAPAGVTLVDYLVIAGAGSGSSGSEGSGGAAGGYINSVPGEQTGGGGVNTTPISVSPNTSYAITVGAGGIGGGGGSGVYNNGTKGGDSSIAALVVALGGAKGTTGGGPSFPGDNGGSGSGGYHGANGAAGLGTAGQGTNGGTGSGSNPWNAGSGGAGLPGGTNASTGGLAFGGDGLYSNITGVNTSRAGGGASSSAADTTTRHYGGIGGGGLAGTFNGGLVGSAGVPNTGSGGGQGGATLVTKLAGNDGGSGIVIIRYRLSVAPVASFTSSNITQVTNSTGQSWAGIAPFTMQFTDTSTGPPTSWVWNATNVTGNNAPFTFNGTFLGTGAYSSPIYTFATAGNYTIKLNATNSAGSNISTQVTWVNVSSGVTLPVPIWSADKYTVVFPGRVNITDTSLNTPTMWNWSAGDGNWHNATIGTNFLYQYTKRGVWQASMTTSNAAGKNTSATKQIRVIGYQGFIPIVPDVCRYSTSRELNFLERAMTDCKVCNICY